MEEWRDIKGFEGKYMVSNLGNVKSLNYRHTGKEKILKAGNHGNGYLKVNLCKDGISKTCTIHRLVATAFCENPHGYKEVNHISEDKTDCRAENLEWCSRSYNNTYNGRAKKAGKKIAEKLRGRKQSEEAKKKRAEKMINNPKKSKPVIGINKVSGLIVEFPSAHEAERTLGIDNSHIIACCKGKYKSAGGYTWHYVESEEVCDEKK